MRRERAGKNRLTSQVEALVKRIRAIPGSKILTLFSPDSGVFKVDMNERGTLGYQKEHDLLFRAKLVSALDGLGILIIRQFLPMKVQRETKSGKKIWIPRKRIYGLRIKSGKWKPLSPVVLKKAHNEDFATGRQLPPEQDVEFWSLSGFTNQTHVNRL